MRFKLPLACVAVLAAIAVKGQPASIEAQTPAAAAVIDVEGRRIEALVKSNIAALNSILADAYLDTDESGHRSNKEELVAALKSGELKMTSIDLADVRVDLYGDFAVVTGVWAEAGTFQGQPVASKIVFTDSFVLLAGQWRVAASQRTIAPPE